MKIARKIFLLCFISSSFWTGNNLHAQEGYYLDSVAAIFFNFQNAGSFSGTKYRYNSDFKIEQIINENYEQIFTYEGNTNYQQINYFDGPGFTILRESIFDNMGNLIIKKQYFDNQLSGIDSFFYENENLVERKEYWIVDNNEETLAKRQEFSYNSDNLIQSSITTDIDYTAQNPDIIITESFAYDQNLNLISKVNYQEYGADYSEYDSTTFSYDLDQTLVEKRNVSGSSLSEPHIRAYTYTYRDSTTIEDEYSFDFNNNPIRAFRLETQYCDHEYYEFDSLIHFTFITDNDSVLTLIETNQLIVSFSEDTILHLTSRTNRDLAGNLSLIQSTKNFYVRSPELVGIQNIPLPKLLISPNPVLPGAPLRIPEVDFFYNTIVIYSLNGVNTQYIKSDKGSDFFSAPREKGLYLVQLWQDNTAVSDIMKILVN